MPLNFPEVADLPLKRSPLSEVLCQVRFPPILRISDGFPTQFQDRIRHRFPRYQREQGVIIHLGRNNEPSIIGGEPASNVHKFSSIDGFSSVTLASDFYALSTAKYLGWEEFALDLSLLHAQVTAAYQPSFATRIGLRYVNTITFDNSGCETLEQMIGLLRPELTSLFCTEAWAYPTELVNQVLLTEGTGRMILRTAIPAQQDPPVLVLDIDSFEEGELPLEDVISRCHRYHDVIYRAFRWSVKDQRLAAFEPVTNGD